jgi:uncharacterized protein (TIGR02646 family)
MRPVVRGASPQAGDFDDYKNAKPDLVSCLGRYCSYCERPIATNLAVEHIQPKSLPAYIALEGKWKNFLLACVNCNSCKLAKDVVLAEVFLPDRDNTFHAFNYRQDGRVVPSAAAIAAGLSEIADRTLALTGLDKSSEKTPDANGKQVALDRVSQRMEVWAKALEACHDVRTAHPASAIMVRDYVVKLAQAEGFFSIWMTVFQGDIDMLNRLIDAFPGTRASGCFDPVTAAPITPAPNPDGLDAGGKL